MSGSRWLLPPPPPLTVPRFLALYSQNISPSQGHHHPHPAGLASPPHALVRHRHQGGSLDPRSSGSLERRVSGPPRRRVSGRRPGGGNRPHPSTPVRSSRQDSRAGHAVAARGRGPPLWRWRQPQAGDGKPTADSAAAVAAGAEHFRPRPAHHRPASRALPRAHLRRQGARGIAPLPPRSRSRGALGGARDKAGFLLTRRGFSRPGGSADTAGVPPTRRGLGGGCHGWGVPLTQRGFSRPAAGVLPTRRAGLEHRRQRRLPLLHPLHLLPQGPQQGGAARPPPAFPTPTPTPWEVLGLTLIRQDYCSARTPAIGIRAKARRRSAARRPRLPRSVACVPRVPSHPDPASPPPADLCVGVHT